ncbi:hemerythrin domain-containing protein [Salipaludibacillus keqinensis]|nr:hemerythrin domain-containing protein [Salipaludibacillus keqinensis]
MQEFQGCASYDLQTPTSYCEALSELLEEHWPLREQMNALKESAMKIKRQKSHSAGEIDGLYQLMRRFKVEIDLHSSKEEDVLFEMMVKHIGRQGGPIAVMEEEHSRAKQHIGYFFEKYGMDKGHPVEKAIELAQHVLVVYQTLTEHFMKEEQILFPMAEKLLSKEEKETLKDQFLQIKISMI